MKILGYAARPPDNSDPDNVRLARHLRHDLPRQVGTQVHDIQAYGLLPTRQGGPGVWLADLCNIRLGFASRGLRLNHDIRQNGRVLTGLLHRPHQ